MKIKSLPKRPEFDYRVLNALINGANLTYERATRLRAIKIHSVAWCAEWEARKQS